MGADKRPHFMDMKCGRLFLRGVWLGIWMFVTGCSQQPYEADAPLFDVRGKVLVERGIQRSAQISLRLYALVDGRPLSIAEARYTVSLLPMHFAFRLASLPQGQGSLWLRSELRWRDSTVVQARSWQSVVAGETVLVRLRTLSDIPN